MFSPSDAARRIVRSLNRPGGRTMLAASYFALGKLKSDWVDALWFDDAWVHRFGQDYLVEPRPRLRASELSETRMRDYCGYLYVPREGDTILDIGAGFGWETIHFARKVGPRGRIVAIEAHPVLARMMQRATSLSGLPHVTALNLAIADTPRTLFLDNDLENHVGNVVGECATEGKIEVRAKTVDQLRTELGLGRIDFIKMNIEGAERLAISGMTETIKHTAVVALSCHDFVFRMTGNEFFRTREIVEDWLRRKGMIIVPRQSADPEFDDQVNAYNPKLIDPAELNPKTMGTAPPERS